MKETVVKRLLGNTVGKLGDIGPKDAILIATYLMKHITYTQLSMLFPEYSAGTFRRYMSELVNDGLINTASLRKPGSVAIYSISRRGIKEALRHIGPHMEENGIDAYTTEPSVLSSCTHRIYANDLYVYVCSSVDKSFDYKQEQAISSDGEFLNTHFEGTGLISDGYFDICLFDNATKMPVSYNIYQEQDMGTQRGSIIKNKLSQYHNFIFNNEDSLYRHELFFTLKVDAVKKEGKASAPESAIIIMQTILAFKGDLTLAAFLDFIDEFGEILKSNIGNRRFNVLLRFLEGAKKDFDDMDMMSTVISVSSGGCEYTSILPYTQRRNMIRQCVNDVPGIMDDIKNGLRIIAINNCELPSSFSWAHICLSDIRLSGDVLGLLGVSADKALLPYRVGGILFPYVKGSTVIENISEDISGYFRARMLFSYGTRVPSENHVLLLSSSVKECIHFMRFVKGMEFSLIKEDGDIMGSSVGGTSYALFDAVSGVDVGLRVNLSLLIEECPCYPLFIVRGDVEHTYIPFLRGESINLYKVILPAYRE